MINQDAVVFCKSWIKARTGIDVTSDEDIFLVAGIDSLDYAELLEDLSDHIGQDYEVERVTDWASLRTLTGLIVNLFPRG